MFSYIHILQEVKKRSLRNIYMKTAGRKKSEADLKVRDVI